MSDEPILPPIDEMMEVDTAYGRIPLWKAKALMVGRIQYVLNDAAEAKHPLTDEEKPPPLAADADQLAGLRRVARLRDYRDIIARCDALLARYDALERKDAAKKAAAKALRDAEAGSRASSLRRTPP